VQRFALHKTAQRFDPQGKLPERKRTLWFQTARTQAEQMLFNIIVVSTVAGIAIQTSPATVVGLTFVSFQMEGSRLGAGALLGVCFSPISGIAGPPGEKLRTLP
jgi:hypothetical protein